ncbi:thymidylate synthase [Roseovarius atlanticus]|uniref:thymidylate synthase n=1 Tax=Roseovarius atlanticus TaxID=1641875 RepID=UPI001C93E299|nr:thymidylate synthase [Roseovarius atlanticus]MBY5989338.1 thymidylate synthase [Roseovarius atlanticus]MBY6124730.1 thymidylate synthase [Roseovarius atlanticus]MBY6149225.1 thymidylate synthase [Roseovarius atlanticus]
MNRFVASLVLPAFLLACGGGTNPFTPDPAAPDPGTGGDDDNPTTDAGIPTALAGDLTRLNYNAATETLTVEGLTLDGGDDPLVYRRRPGMDRNGYQAYTFQDDGRDRHYTIYVAEANNNSGVRAGAGISGGPRNRVFGGGYYERDGDFSPATGQVSYAGNYVGVTNLNGSGEDLTPPPAGLDPDLVPTQAAEVTGRVELQANFGDDATVEGNIIERTLVDSGTALPSIVLVNTPISSDGTFVGQAEYEQGDFPGENVIGQKIGDYGGIFGGTNASGVAGVIHLEEFDGPNNPLGFETEEEYGVFVLDQCGQPVEDAVGCAGTNP